jgi:hypothetical protein
MKPVIHPTILNLSYGIYARICPITLPVAFTVCIYSQYHHIFAMAYPGILFGGGSTNSVEDRENGDLGAVAP